MQTADSTESIALYGVRATAVGVAISVAAAAAAVLIYGLANGLTADAKALYMPLSAASVLMALSWLSAAGVAALTGPYRPAQAGFSWLVLSAARNLLLLVAAAAAALAMPDAGMPLWIGLVAGGVAGVAADSVLAARAIATHPTRATSALPGGPR
ncbi:MAG: hypothetical protein AAFX79_05625 [Planctomycetota bacterium]